MTSGKVNRNFMDVTKVMIDLIFPLIEKKKVRRNNLNDTSQ